MRSHVSGVPRVKITPRANGCDVEARPLSGSHPVLFQKSFSAVLQRYAETLRALSRY